MEDHLVGIEKHLYHLTQSNVGPGASLIHGKLDGHPQLRGSSRQSHSWHSLSGPGAPISLPLPTLPLTRPPCWLCISTCFPTSKLNAISGKPSLIRPVPLIASSFKFMMAFYVFSWHWGYLCEGFSSRRSLWFSWEPNLTLFPLCFYRLEQCLWYSGCSGLSEVHEEYTVMPFLLGFSWQSRTAHFHLGSVLVTHPGGLSEGPQESGSLGWTSSSLVAWWQIVYSVWGSELCSSRKPPTDE